MFDPLATEADLDDRNITVPDGMFAPAVLDSASAAVREAAGCPISQATSTVTLVGDDMYGLDLPGVPVTAVASVAIEGVAVAASTLVNGHWGAGWRLSGNRVLLNGQRFEIPAAITVTYTHGLPAIPTDIIDLVCSLAAMAFTTEYGSAGRLGSTRLGDFAETYVHPSGTESPSPLAIPDAVRDRLRARFGTSVAMVGAA